MSEFVPRILKNASRQLKKLDPSVAKRLLGRINWLAQHFDGVKPEALKGDLSGLFKYREGDYRIIYEPIGAPPHKRLHVTTLTGTITSRAGRFELTTEVFNPPESTKPESTSATNGLFIIEPELQSIKLLERGEKRTRIVIANRVPETIT